MIFLFLFRRSDQATSIYSLTGLFSISEPAPDLLGLSFYSSIASGQLLLAGASDSRSSPVIYVQLADIGIGTPSFKTVVNLTTSTLRNIYAAMQFTKAVTTNDRAYKYHEGLSTDLSVGAALATRPSLVEFCSDNLVLGMLTNSNNMFYVYYIDSNQNMQLMYSTQSGGSPFLDFKCKLNAGQYHFVLIQTNSVTYLKLDYGDSTPKVASTIFTNIESTGVPSNQPRIDFLLTASGSIRTIFINYGKVKLLDITTSGISQLKSFNSAFFNDGAITKVSSSQRLTFAFVTTQTKIWVVSINQQQILFSAGITASTIGFSNAAQTVLALGQNSANSIGLRVMAVGCSAGFLDISTSPPRCVSSCSGSNTIYCYSSCPYFNKLTQQCQISCPPLSFYFYGPGLIYCVPSCPPIPNSVCVQACPTNKPDGSCNCLGGTFPLAATVNRLATCLTCDKSCATCSSASSCLSCAQNYALIGVTCTCPSQKYYYNNNRMTCSQCLSQCLTCVNAATCSSCSPGKYLTPSSICATCMTVCRTCISQNTCQSCPDGAFLSNSLCTACLSKCVTCSDGSGCLVCRQSFVQADSQCSCDPNALLNSQQNLCSCKQGYFASLVNQCTVCHYSCATCTGLGNTNCIACKTESGFTAQLGGCLCPAAKFTNSQFMCSDCPNQCTSCSNLQACSSCQATYVLTDSKCECRPNSILSGSSCICVQYFRSASDQICQACFSLCPTCSGSNRDQCLSCKVGYQLTVTTCLCRSRYYMANNLSCINCNSLCQTCANAASCLTCIDTNHLLSDGVCTCKVSFYSSGSSCSACPNTCLSCLSATACLTCIPALRLNFGLCECLPTFAFKESSLSCVCPPLAFLDGQACSKCDLSCNSCRGKARTDCLSCHPGMSLATNYCKCPSAQLYFDYSLIKCQSCNQTCSSCTGPSYNQCTACVPGTTLAGTSCRCPVGAFFNKTICACPVGYLSNKEGECWTCGANCANCTGPLTLLCFKCEDGFSLQQSNVCMNASTANQQGGKVTGSIGVAGVTTAAAVGGAAGGGSISLLKNALVSYYADLTTQSGSVSASYSFNSGLGSTGFIAMNLFNLSYNISGGRVLSPLLKLGDGNILRLAGLPLLFYALLLLPMFAFWFYTGYYDYDLHDYPSLFRFTYEYSVLLKQLFFRLMAVIYLLLRGILIFFSISTLVLSSYTQQQSIKTAGIITALLALLCTLGPALFAIHRHRAQRWRVCQNAAHLGLELLIPFLLIFIRTQPVKIVLVVVVLTDLFLWHRAESKWELGLQIAATLAKAFWLVSVFLGLFQLQLVMMVAATVLTIVVLAVNLYWDYLLEERAPELKEEDVAPEQNNEQAENRTAAQGRAPSQPTHNHLLIFDLNNDGRSDSDHVREDVQPSD